MTKRKATIDYILMNWRTEWEVLGTEEVGRMGCCIVCTCLPDGKLCPELCLREADTGIANVKMQL